MLLVRKRECGRERRRFEKKCYLTNLILKKRKMSVLRKKGKRI